MPSFDYNAIMLLVLCGIAALFLGTWSWRRRVAARKAQAHRRAVEEEEAARIATELRDLHTRVEAMQKQFSLLGQAALPISTAFQALLIKELTHFHTPRMDELMVKLGPPMRLTDAEETELLAALARRERDMGDLISPSERDAAHILPIVMKRAKAETALLGEVPLAHRLVTVIAPFVGEVTKGTTLREASPAHEPPPSA